jgi:opacity protein-like surface antigen
MNVRRLFIATSTVLLGFSFPAESQEPPVELTRPKGFYISGFHTRVMDPFFKQPSGNDELTVSQSADVISYNLSYLYLDDDFGGGIGLTYWNSSFDSFQAPAQDGSTNNVAYKNPSLSMFFVDLQLHFLPWKAPISFYGVLGLGSGNETYTISGATSPFTDWNGAKDISEFQYSYGIGVQVFLWRFVSLQTEIRWIPGQMTIEYSDYLYTKDGYDYYGKANDKTENHISLFSFGISIGGLW